MGATTSMNSRVVHCAAALLACAFFATPTLARTPGTFSVACNHSHTLPDDPIVHPNIPGTSHLHDFYGSRTTNGSSTYETMLASGSSCGSIADTAGYWHPALTVDGHAIVGSITAYYTSGQKSARSISSYPEGLMMLAGTAATTEPQPLSLIAYRCVGKAWRGPAVSTPRHCKRRQHLAAFIRFPDCWNGTDTDSINHRDHVAYSSGKLCPGGFPYSLPILALRIDWPIRARPASIMLSSGAPLSLHGDFWNAWEQGTLNRLVNRCIRRRKTCGLIRS